MVSLQRKKRDLSQVAKHIKQRDIQTILMMKLLCRNITTKHDNSVKQREIKDEANKR